MPLSKARNKARMKAIRLHAKIEEGVVQPKAVPLYNPMKHRAGDRVMIQRGNRLIETVIPDLDGDGNPIYDDAM